MPTSSASPNVTSIKLEGREGGELKDPFRLTSRRSREIKLWERGISYAMQTSSYSQCDVRNTPRLQTGKRMKATNELAHARYQKVAQLYYTLSECIMEHVGGEPLLDEDVRVGNHIITVLSTELVSLSSSPLSSMCIQHVKNMVACLQE